jgi:hypothetical protein
LPCSKWPESTKTAVRAASVMSHSSASSMCRYAGPLMRRDHRNFDVQ